MIVDSKRQVNLTYQTTALILAAMERERLDVLLHRMGLANSREQARRLIMAGQVSVDGETTDKAGTRVPLTAKIDIQARPTYVSRGGLKLEAALAAFAVKVRGMVAADIGASTGGFTDCLLQHGATRVYAVDVGYGQLAWSLRQDPRVVAMERVNARYLHALPEPIDLITIDVSFISLRLVLPALVPLLKPVGQIIALAKPQFEAGRRQVGKGGVVRDPAVHRAVLHDLLTWASANGLQVQGVVTSPLRGPAGNIEFLVHWVPGIAASKSRIEEVIRTGLSGCQTSLDTL
jgi:23S rRNA (cytidine1920-2'-O)/16S rRNA (cytidine1409-2'-O)-methyltransferase